MHAMSLMQRRHLRRAVQPAGASHAHDRTVSNHYHLMALAVTTVVAVVWVAGGGRAAGDHQGPWTDPG